ncbi:MAG TPA: S9 family peptidase [Acidimicrobiales bacterium]|nr:S9 family peptidase [Acidimicrobiales bacterium]
MRDAAADIAVPPVAARRPTVLETHGDRRVDDWHWLRDRDDPAVLAHLRAENDYTEAVTAGQAGLRQTLFDEIRARIAETDLSVAVRKDEWWYFARTFEGRDYPVHCRAPVASADGSPEAGSVRPPGADGTGPGPWPAEEVLLDENVLAEGVSYLALSDLEISPGHGLLAYGIDTTGDERFAIKVRNLTTGEELPEVLEGVSYGLAWADDATFFYTRPDTANRPHQVWRHQIGTDASADLLVMEEPDERFHIGLGRTKDGAYVVVSLDSKITSEVWVVPTAVPATAPRLVTERRPGIEYAIEHHRGTFVIVTNHEAENFRLMAVPADAPAGHPWREVIAHRSDVRLLGAEVFRRHVACYERFEGEARIRVVDLAEDTDPWAAPLPDGRVIPSPESPATFRPAGNPEFDTLQLRYEYTSLVTPRSIFDFDMDAGTSELLKRQPVLGGYDPVDFITSRLWADAADGRRVPMSLVHHRDTPLDGTAPCLLYGYGAYEHSIDPAFSSLRLSLLERGLVYGIAHVRGGGELGRRWYEEGKLLAKPNTFSDFIACAEHLVTTGAIDGSRLVARGASAGGLLMGAVANLAPGRFRAMVAEVPFVDCLTTMLDETLPLTVIEWDEWGNPAADPEVYAAMRSYSPYDNVRSVRYPEMLVTAGLEDPRVGYWEPAKWAQRLRAADPDNQVLLKVELEAGHGGPTGRYDAWRDEAFVQAFVLEAVRLSGS